jgi:hypothetical protein
MSQKGGNLAKGHVLPAHGVMIARYDVMSRFKESPVQTACLTVMTV